MPARPRPTIQPGSLEAVIVRFVKNHKASLRGTSQPGFELQPFKDTILSITGMHVRGVPPGQLLQCESAGREYVLQHGSRGGFSYAATILMETLGPRTTIAARPVPPIPQIAFPARCLELFRTFALSLSAWISKLTPSGTPNGTGCW